MKIHYLATLSHYARHLDAIWQALPDELKGEQLVGRTARTRGIPNQDVIMVAGLIDVERVVNHRVVYVEHGAGQMYAGLPVRTRPFYPHGPSVHPARVIGYISPREEIASIWRRPAAAVGCPALDRIERKPEYVAAITFHWDPARPQRLVPEVRSARPHYLEHLTDIVAWLREWGYSVIGHAHPRDTDAAGIWAGLGLEYEPDPDAVLDKARFLIADNTSLLYEASALGIQTITLNAPWYRRDVHHGLRFWDAVPGVAVDNADELYKLDLSDLDPADCERASMAAYDMARHDHKAAERAVAFVMNLLGLE